jgi:hypothetical protein
MPTQSKVQTCAECKSGEAKRPPRTCDVCGLPTTAGSGTCRTCTFAPDHAPSPADELTGGRWLVVAGGVRRWVPDGEGYDDLARTDAETTRRRARVRDLDQERLDGGWFTRHGELFDDSPHRQAHRLAELTHEAWVDDDRAQEQETAA